CFPSNQTFHNIFPEECDPLSSLLLLQLSVCLVLPWHLQFTINVALLMVFLVMIFLVMVFLVMVPLTVFSRPELSRTILKLLGVLLVVVCPAMALQMLLVMIVVICTREDAYSKNYSVVHAVSLLIGQT
ncbi:hypothetical protein BCV72DRAFT_76703, partial [Rhizopus microsporus var. microsporus]